MRLLEAEAELTITAREGGNQIHIQFAPTEFHGTDPGFKSRWRMHVNEAAEFRTHVHGTVRAALYDKENAIVSFQLAPNVAQDVYFKPNDVDRLVQCLDEAITLSRSNVGVTV